MKRKVAVWSALCLLWAVLAACSSEEPLDVTAIEAIVATNPERAKAGSAVELIVTFNGVKAQNKAKVVLDIRIDEKPVLVTAEDRRDGSFVGPFTFPAKGAYEVYVHFYYEDIHLTLKNAVEVH